MTSTDPLTPVLQEWVGIIMRRTMHSSIIFLKQNDLTMSQIGALFQINRGKSNVSDLGGGLAISTAGASQMLERLVQQELILRSEDPQDRRVKKLLLTDKGRRIIEEITLSRQGWLRELVADLSPDEKEQIGAAIRILIDKARKTDQHSKAEW